ncbi:hypothetical protein AMECASPLE_026338 [Ameca splendens]|uniref:Uncharacterized protein n=1 Tax=Ameca splendens TaxID=208324 RepID=A0ABV0XHW2_9TELE
MRANLRHLKPTPNTHTTRVDKSEFLFSFWCFFQILTQILSVCPLLCCSHDNTCRRNSGRQENGGKAQGLQVEERAGGDREEGENREWEGGMDGGRKGSGN